MKVLENIWKWFDGKKSLISAMLIMIVNSDYVAARIPDEQLYMLIQGIVAGMFAGGMFHKGVKAMKK